MPVQEPLASQGRALTQLSMKTRSPKSAPLHVVGSGTLSWILCSLPLRPDTLCFPDPQLALLLLDLCSPLSLITSLSTRSYLIRPSDSRNAHECLCVQDPATPFSLPVTVGTPDSAPSAPRGANGNTVSDSTWPSLATMHCTYIAPHPVSSLRGRDPPAPFPWEALDTPDTRSVPSLFGGAHPAIQYYPLPIYIAHTRTGLRRGYRNRRGNLAQPFYSAVRVVGQSPLQTCRGRDGLADFTVRPDEPALPHLVNADDGPED
ncbi:hypothetical protein FB451DRAFT_1400625 [Mycena latifolia]|nr:hypothetical protein FB451DRAFT_1400625 [Mycena latifolia]